MQKEDFIVLLNKVTEGTASDQELAAYLRWYKAFPEAENVWAELNDQPDLFRTKLLARINEHIEGVRVVAPRKLWPRIAAVAAAVALIVLGVYFFNAPSRHLDTSSSRTAGRDLLNDIAPGKNGATLTLANGKVIQLSDAKTGVVIGDDLRYSDNTAITTPPSAPLLGKEGTLDHPSPPFKGGVPAGGGGLTASTTKGQTYEFTLPDGTKVWLNAASTLTIPSGFSGTETRKVELTGEAYFEVAKNKKRPFTVVSNGQQITVLGTHFNVSAYGDENAIKTTLLEGSVRVVKSPPFEGGVPEGGGGRIGKTTPASPPLLGKEGTILKPGQQSVVSGSNRISVKQVNPEDAVAWKNGKFRFDETPMEEVLRQIGRWYNLDIQYPDGIPDRKFSGGINRNVNLSSVLGLLSDAKIRFKLNDKTLIIENK